MINWTVYTTAIIERVRGLSSPGPKRFRIMGVIILYIRKALVLDAQSAAQKSFESQDLQDQYADESPETLQPLHLPSTIHIPFLNSTARLPIPIPSHDRELDLAMNYCDKRPLDFFNQGTWHGYAVAHGVPPNRLIIPLRDFHFTQATDISGRFPTNGTGHLGPRSVRLVGSFNIRTRDLTLETHCSITGERLSMGVLSPGPLGLFGSMDVMRPDGSYGTVLVMVWLWKDDWAR